MSSEEKKPEENKSQINFEDESVKKAISEAAAKLAEEQINSATTGLVNKNKELIGEKKAVKEKLEELDSQLKSLNERYDFEELDALKAKSEEDRIKALSAEEKYQETIENMSSSFTTEKNELLLKHEEFVSKLSAERDDLESKFFKNLKGNTVKDAMSEHGGKPHLLENLISGDTKVQKDDSGNYSLVVTDSNGQVRVNSDGTPLTVSQRVSELKADEKYGACFNGSGAGGGGAGGSDQQQAPKPKVEYIKSKMSAREKAALIKEIGAKEFDKIPYR